MNSDLEYYLQQASYKLERVNRKNDRSFHFRCNICGDSDKNSRKKRGWLFLKDNNWRFHCFNCNISLNANIWLKRYFPDVYQDYIRSSFNTKSYEQIESKQTLIDKQIIEESINIKDYYKDCKFIPIMSEIKSVLIEDARKLCINRRIPENIWQRFYVCTEGRLSRRLIIPFYNDKKIEYFTARSIYKSDTRYINMIGPKRVYGIHDIDLNEPVICLEGPIDSIFVQNSIAILGLSSNETNNIYLNKLDCHFLFDNDVTGLRETKKALKKGKSVFLWSKYLKKYDLYYEKIKDVNDLILKTDKKTQFTYEELKSFFTNSVLDVVNI